VLAQISQVIISLNQFGSVQIGLGNGNGRNRLMPGRPIDKGAMFNSSSSKTKSVGSGQMSDRLFE
jgi:hypothetical protein